MKFLRHELPPMLKLAAPIVLAELGWMGMPIADTMMVGRLPYSAEAIGATGLGAIVFNTVGFFGTGLMLGLDSLVSHSYGAGEIEDCHRSLVNGVYLALLTAPVLTAIVWLLSIEMGPLGVRPELVARLVPYAHALVWGMLPLLLYFVFRRYLQAINQVMPVMFALLSANVVNLVGNWVLIYGHWGFRARGVTGSGWSTTIALSYMAVLLMAYTLFHDYRYKTGLRNASTLPDIVRMRGILRLGFPAASQIMVEIGLFAVVTSLIGRLGPLQLASHQIALNAVSATYMVPLGIGSAAAVRVGQALGRKDPEGARHSGWTAISMGASFMGCMAIILLTAPKYVVRLFTPDVAVIQAAAKLLFVAAFFQLFDGVQAVATGALRGSGDTRTPLMAHAIAYWAIGLPLGYFLGFHRGLGAIGLWMGISVAIVLIGVTLLLAWRRTVRRLAERLR